VLRAAAVNKTNSELTSDSLGYWLRNKKGREHAGIKFVKNVENVKKMEAGVLWKLVGHQKAEAQSAPAAPATDSNVTDLADWKVRTQQANKTLSDAEIDAMAATL
jgi:hypothetical protein